MKRKKAGPSGIPDIPLQRTSQAKAAEAGIASVREGRLKLYDERADNVRRFLDLIKERITRPVLPLCPDPARRPDHDARLQGRPDPPRLQEAPGLDGADRPVVGSRPRPGRR
jgi:hypothetical protein